MKVLGYIVVIKRSGCDGTPYPMVNTSCSMGRNMECDIRVQLPVVSQRHCQVEVDPSGKAYVTNLSQARATIVNDHAMAAQEVKFLAHKDIISIGERQFRWEYPEGSTFSQERLPEHFSAVGYRILTPTTKSPISWHNVEESRGEKRSRVEAEFMEASDAKKKRVSFGPQLNPEHFDKLLPPSTPVSKGERPSGLPENLALNSSVRRSKRVSEAPSIPLITEEPCPDTPTKSLLRRRSPTPVKPYLARSLGLNLPKALEISGDQTSPTQGKVVNGIHHSPGSSEQQPLTMSSMKADIIDSLQSPCSSKKVRMDLSVHSEIVSPRKAKEGSPRGTTKTGKNLESPGKSSHNPTPNRTSRNSSTGKTSQSKAASPRNSKSPPQSPKHSPKSMNSPKSSPKRYKSPSKDQNSPRTSRTGSVSPRTASGSLKSPSGSPKNIKSPKGTPKKITSSEKYPKKIVTPKSLSPKGTPKFSLKLQNETPKKTPKASPKTSPKASPKTTPKASPKTTPKASPKTTPKASPKTTPKASPKTTPKASPKKTPNASPKKTPNASPKKTPKASPKKISKASPKKTPKASPKTTPKASPKTTPKASPKKTPKASPKKTPKASPKTTPKASPKTTPKASPKTTPKASPKTTPKASPKTTPKASPKTTPKASPKTTPKASPKTTPKASPKTTPRASPKTTPKASPKTTPRASPKTTPRASPKTTPRASPKTTPRASPKTTPRASPKKTPKASPKTTPKASPKTTPRASPKTTPRASSKATPKASSKATPKASSKATPRATPKASPKTTPKKTPPASPKKTPKSGMKSNSKSATKASPKVTSKNSPGPALKLVKKKVVLSPKKVIKISPKSSIKKTPLNLGTPRHLTKSQSVKKNLTNSKNISKKSLNLSWSASGGIRKGLESTPKTPKISNSSESPIILNLSPSSPRINIKSSPKTPKSPKSVIHHTPKSSQSFKGTNTPKTPIMEMTRSPQNQKGLQKTPRPIIKAVSVKNASGRSSNKLSVKKVKTPKSPRGEKRKAETTPSYQPSKRMKITTTVKSGQKIANGKTPRRTNGKTPKKSFADVLKRGLMVKGIRSTQMQKAHQVLQKAKKARISRSQKSALQKTNKTPTFSTEVPKSFKFGQSTTGHVNSPATIFIRKKTAKTPRVFKKGQKTQVKTSARISGDKIDFEGLSKLMATPKIACENTSRGSSLEESHGGSPKLRSPRSYTRENIGASVAHLSFVSTSTSYTNATNFDFSAIKTPDVTADMFVSPLVTPIGSIKTPERLLRSGKSVLESPENVPLEEDATTFDFASARTPNVSRDDFVSPVNTKTPIEETRGVLPKTRLSRSTSRSENKTPQNRLLHTPSTSASTPKPSYENVIGMRHLFETPIQEENSLNMMDEEEQPKTRRLSKTSSGDDTNMNLPNASSSSLQADYTNVIGVRKLMQSPNSSEEPPEADNQVRGLNKLLKTPKAASQTPTADYTRVGGVKKLLKTPRSSENNPPVADYTQVTGVKKLMKTPKPTHASPVADYSQVAGVKKLMQTPKPSIPEYEADDTHLAGIRKVLRTPKSTIKSPEADYTNVAGVKALLRTPREHKSSPVADYSNVVGVKQLMKTPKSSSEAKTKENEADYTQIQGIRNLVKTPRHLKNHIADYTNPGGLKKLLATPHTPVNSPEADYSNVQGLRALMRTPKNKRVSLELDLDGLNLLMKTPLADQTNVVGRVVNLHMQSSSPGSKKKNRTPKVISPISSSLSENDPPVEVSKQDTPRRSQRKTRRAAKQACASPMQKFEQVVDTDFNQELEECVLELVQTSLGKSRSLRSKRGAVREEKPVVTRKKSKKIQKIDEEQTNQIQDVFTGKKDTTTGCQVNSLNNPSEQDQELANKIADDEPVQSPASTKRRTRKQANLEAEVVSSPKSKRGKRRKQDSEATPSKQLLREADLVEVVVPSPKGRRGRSQKKDSEVTPSSVETNGSEDVIELVSRGRVRTLRVNTEQKTTPKRNGSKIDSTESESAKENREDLASKDSKEVGKKDVKPVQRTTRNKTQNSTKEQNGKDIESETDGSGEETISTRSTRGCINIDSPAPELPKTRRQAASKATAKILKSLEGVTSDSTKVSEEDVKITRSARIRSTKKATKDKDFESKQDTETKTRGTRGRTTKKAIESEEKADKDATAVEKKTRGGRRKGTKNADKVEENESEKTETQLGQNMNNSNEPEPKKEDTEESGGKTLRSSRGRKCQQTTEMEASPMQTTRSLRATRSRKAHAS